MLLAGLFFCLVAGGSSSSAPILFPIDNSLKCAACQFGAHFLEHSNGTKFEGDHLNRAKEGCLKMEDCETKLTDCEMIHAVNSIIPPDNEHYKAFSFAIRMISLKCVIDPETEVMNDFELPKFLKCDICKLIYNILSEINTGLQTNKVINTDIPALIETVCDLVSLFFGSPALCFPLLDPDVHSGQALIQGILDSLGSFYDAIGKPFGCPAWQHLFDSDPCGP